LQTMENPSSGKTRKVIASVQRALDIMDLFGDGNRAELGNAEIAKLLGLPTGTAAGLIHTLHLNNYLDQNPANRKYRLGLKLMERSSVLLEQLDLHKVSLPHLEKLRQWCDESINLAIRDGNEVVYMQRLFGNHTLGIRAEPGKRAPIHSTALGKAILSFSPPAAVRTFLEHYNFFKVTKYTITNFDQFVQELTKVSEKGYSVDDEENEIGGRCVAAPVFNQRGYPVAAISISVPVQRLPRERLDEYGGKVKEAAMAISIDLGYQSSSGSKHLPVDRK
jgi:IclR family KDG regulon transcriptional repressor